MNLAWVRSLTILLAVLRGAYGLRSPIAGILHRIGLEGELGYSGSTTRSIAETAAGWELLTILVQLGYFLIAWALWKRAAWLIWLAIGIYLVDQAIWITFSLSPGDVAAHGQDRIESGVDPDLTDWLLFLVETLIAASALALGIRNQDHSRGRV
ncbi:hypothetical protein [Maricaulis sp.]|uniref:hypothetical protein n=1 Tax=Maricaulis sp. TaxID=1486257 RepID=UPI0025C1EF69|nr:hypothetical protein [Maricaulis sp.]